MLKPAFLCRAAIVIAFCLLVNGAPSGEGGGKTKHKLGSKKNPVVVKGEKEGKRAIPNIWIDGESAKTTHHVTDHFIDVRVETTPEGSGTAHAFDVWINVFRKNEAPSTEDPPPTTFGANSLLQTYDSGTKSAYWVRYGIPAASDPDPGAEYVIVVWARYHIGAQWTTFSTRHTFKAVTVVYPPGR